MTIDQNIPYLSGQFLEDLALSTDDVINSIESMISGSMQGSVWSAPKAVMLPDDGRYMMAALAAADEPPYLAVKTVVLNPRNPEKGLPQINGLVTILDSQTGVPVAIMDGNWVTAVRTAGLSATAAKHMARKDSEVASFVGCGVQARSHLQAFNEMFPLKQVQVFGRGQANIDSFCAFANSLSLEAEVFSSAEDVIQDSDIVVTSVTYSTSFVPFLNASVLKPGSFTAVTDLGAPWVKEQFSIFDQLIIDDLAQEAALPNKIVPPEFVSGDISQLVLGEVDGRKKDSDRNAFIFRGHALGDLALSSLALQKSGVVK